jgi:hypothetical protein
VRPLTACPIPFVRESMNLPSFQRGISFFGVAVAGVRTIWPVSKTVTKKFSYAETPALPRAKRERSSAETMLGFCQR